MQENGYPEGGDVIRAKWVMDGANNLEQAALRLEEFALYLRTLHSKGWTLRDTVNDDYGFLVDPDGYAGEDFEEDEDWKFDEDDDELKDEAAQEEELVEHLKI